MPETSPSLLEVIEDRIVSVSGFAGLVVALAILGKNIKHQYRARPDDRMHDLNGPFWQRHRDLDDTLVDLSMNLPSELRIPRGVPNPNIILMNVCIHTATILLHTSALFVLNRHIQHDGFKKQSMMRRVAAASEIVNIMRAVSHLNLSEVGNSKVDEKDAHREHS